MLKKLIIKNYALIDSLELDFSDGLTIVTGETGAGKSIMLGALSMIMGGRADARVISDGGAKSVVEAFFADPPEDLKEMLSSLDLDWMDSELVIRREIAANGRSRAFVNDAPVTLTALSGISSRLIDIHSQHENARLNNASMQLQIIDAVSDNEQLRRRYSGLFHRFVEIRTEVKRLRDEIEKARENREYLQFQYDGLKALSPKRGELVEIERRFELLSDADEIRGRLESIRALLGENERGAADQLRSAKAEMDRIDLGLVGIASQQGSQTIPERLGNAIVEIQDIFETVDDALATMDSDPATLDKLSRRMNDYYDALKQYRVADADELVGLKENIEQKLTAIDTGGDRLPELEREGKKVAAELKEAGNELTESRRKAASVFSTMVTDAAKPLGLPNLNFRASISTGKIGPSGQDHVEFECAFNKNQEPHAIAGMASGGEMSRLMLVIKRLLAGKLNLPTIIFDEIDTGVSGDIADKMGQMMLDMSRDMQVIAITHLPQVAAKGESHFKVYKEDNENRTNTHVRRLDAEDRVREIAAMMSGSKVSEAALDNARALLSATENEETPFKKRPNGDGQGK